MECQKCNVKITHTNWSRHVRTWKYLKNDPDQTIQLRRRGRPKTKSVPDKLFNREDKEDLKPNPFLIILFNREEEEDLNQTRS